MLIETQGNWTPHSEDPAHEILDLYTTVEAGASLVFTPAWSLNSTVVVEPVEDPAPFHNRLFGGKGAFIEQLCVTYDASSWTVFAGKFNPAFAIAWDIAPGLYGTDIAEDYELTERIGLGVRLTGADGRGGGLQLSAALFNVDTTVLSNSLLVNRGRTHRHSRAPGNAGELSSWSLALTSHHPAEITGLTLHVALSHQAAREGPAQNGRALAAHYAIPLGERLAASVLVEWVHFTGFEGRRTADGTPARADYVTPALELTTGPWSLALAYSARRVHAAQAPPDRQWQLSAGHRFAGGVLLDIGWKRFCADGVKSDLVGARIAYTLSY